MPISLSDVRRMAQDVAHEHGPDVEVLAATRGEGASDYGEVILAVHGRAPEPHRFIIGISRNGAESEIRGHLRDQVKRHVDAYEGHPD